MRITIIPITTLFFVLLAAPAPSIAAGRCEGYTAAIMVDTSMHTMWVCLDSQERSAYRVSLGRGGTGKQRRGDRKTPLGRYALGSPRGSAKYRLFIPVSFPSDEQKALGASGGNIGIHGPHREFLWLGHDSTEADWTNGCIAVGTDDEIREVTRWVTESGITSVIIQ